MATAKKKTHPKKTSRAKTTPAAAKTPPQAPATPELDDEDAPDAEAREGRGEGDADLDGEGADEAQGATQITDGDEARGSEVEIDPREAAAARIGHSLHAHLEALHMTDRDDAIRAISTIISVAPELAQIGMDLEILGAGDLARDVRLAVDRMKREQDR
jgi:hypothetical protein